MNCLTECQDILSVDAFVVDGVHEVAHEQDAESSHRTFLCRECRVGSRDFRRVEGNAGVGDDELQPMPIGHGTDVYFACLVDFAALDPYLTADRIAC